MGKGNSLQEVRLAFFGEGFSGKTTLLASYFGNQQRDCFENKYGYRLEAEDVSDGNLLLSDYYGMERGSFPNGTGSFVDCSFLFKLKGLPEPALRIRWYDYPGGWWERMPKDDSERQARRVAFEKLLTSHVGVLLIDGAKYKIDGLQYVRKVLDVFKNEVRRISDELAASGNPISALPRQWLVAISKADLLPDQTAEAISKEIVKGAADQLAGVANAVDSRQFGNDFLLLSSVRGNGATVIDAHESSALQLIVPVVLLSILTEAAQRADNGAVFGTLKSIMKRLSSILVLLDQLDDWLPPKYQLVTGLLKAIALKEGVDKGCDYFLEKQQAAAKRGKALEAAVAAMQAELAKPGSERVFFRNQNHGE